MLGSRLRKELLITGPFWGLGRLFADNLADDFAVFW